MNGIQLNTIKISTTTMSRVDFLLSSISSKKKHITFWLREASIRMEIRQIKCKSFSSLFQVLKRQTMFKYSSNNVCWKVISSLEINGSVASITRQTTKEVSLTWLLVPREPISLILTSIKLNKVSVFNYSLKGSNLSDQRLSASCLIAFCNLFLC